MVLGEKKMNASSLGEDDMLSGEGLSTQYLVLQPEYVSRGISWQRPSKMGPVCGKVRAGRDLDFNGAGGLHIWHSISWDMPQGQLMLLKAEAKHDDKSSADILL